VIRQNAESLAGLVDMLFDLSRNASGSLRLKLEAVDLNQLAVVVADSTYPAAQRHQVSLRIDRARTPLLVTGDRIRLEQVIRNLLENAIKFTPAGGSVTLRTSRRAADAELSVHDTGAGISREQLPVIFDPFRQGLAPVESADVGLGLGLALARDLVHLHHGEIRARSAGVGCGSTFTVTLPLASSPGGGQ
jgi:signal transduction histidine kinase